MLEELRIHNFAIIDNLEIRFDRGLNVITGETGAGKSIIVDAVELIIGGRSDVAQVRAGAEKASVEGDFALDKVTRTLILPVLTRENLLEGERPEDVTLAREIRANGRSIARVNGVTVSQEVLREIGGILVDIHGQSEHLSLFEPRHHIDLLDRFADLLEIRAALATVVESLAEVRAEIAQGMADEAAITRRADQLRHEIEEIDTAKLRVGEDKEIKTERNRLANSEQLMALTAEILQLLNGDERHIGAMAAVAQLMRVATLLGKLAEIDADLRESAEQIDGLSAQVQDFAIEMTKYSDNIEFDPQRIDAIEERLEVIHRLRRRYGLTVELVLEHAEKARRELNRLEHNVEHLTELREKETLLLKQIGELGANMSKVRQKIGQQLSKRVVQELQDLRMERTRFEVAITHRPDPDGCYVGEQRLAFTDTGIDQVEFMLSPNPGEPLRPLVKIASGGEASRIMLSLKRVLTAADHIPILIFDEVDQGIGGRVGSVVGQKLWELTGKHQVLVVTHLPQLAGYADRHFHVQKRVIGERTATQIGALTEEPQRVEELAAMLGATGEGSQQSAREILHEARAYKANKVTKS